MTTNYERQRLIETFILSEALILSIFHFNGYLLFKK